MDNPKVIFLFLMYFYGTIREKDGGDYVYQIVTGNAYKIFNDGDVICTTTNGEVKKDGKAVMGAGVAKFVRDTFPGVDVKLAQLLNEHGNRAFKLGTYDYNGKPVVLATFPTKEKWNESSKLDLIETSAKQLMQMADKFGWKNIYIPIPGCSNGGLVWSQVKERLLCLDNRFIIFSLNKNDFLK